MSEYAQRNIMELEPHYCKHVQAMTAEGLHSKSDIAAELAYRDARLETLEWLEAINELRKLDDPEWREGCEKQIAQQLERIAELEKQCDELLEALKEIAKDDRRGSYQWFRNFARAVIARVEESK